MPVNILMPALSPTMEEGKLARWLVKEGDVVKSGTILAEIETDKATMEFEAVDEGRIGKLLVPAGGDAVKVNAPIAVLLADGEKMGDVNIPAAMASIKDAVKAETPKAAAARAPPATIAARTNVDPPITASSLRIHEAAMHIGCHKFPALLSLSASDIGLPPSLSR